MVSQSADQGGKIFWSQQTRPPPSSVNIFEWQLLPYLDPHSGSHVLTFRALPPPPTTNTNCVLGLRCEQSLVGCLL